MKAIKLTKADLIKLNRSIPIARSIACKPRTPDYGVSQYTRTISKGLHAIHS